MVIKIGLVGAPACGDVMKLQVEVDENGTVVNAKFKTFGCGSAIASSSVATEWLIGKKVDDCLSITVSDNNLWKFLALIIIIFNLTLNDSFFIQNADIASHLKLPPVKKHCSMLAEDAIKAAIKDYQTKQQKAATA